MKNPVNNSAIFFKKKSKVSPNVVRPDRNHYVSCPMPEPVWTALFPDAVQIKPTKAKSFKFLSKVRCFKKSYSNPLALAPVLGNKWHIFHYGTDVGVFTGKITFTFATRIITEYQNEIQLGCLGSLKQRKLSFFSASFTFTRINRIDPRGAIYGETNSWKQRVSKLLAKKHVRKIKL